MIREQWSTEQMGGLFCPRWSDKHIAYMNICMNGWTNVWISLDCSSSEFVAINIFNNIISSSYFWFYIIVSLIHVLIFTIMIKREFLVD